MVQYFIFSKDNNAYVSVSYLTIAENSQNYLDPEEKSVENFYTPLILKYIPLYGNKKSSINN